MTPGEFSFLITGASRGGTSILTALVGSHPQVQVGFERHYEHLLGRVPATAGTITTRLSGFRTACEQEAEGQTKIWGNKVTAEHIGGLTGNGIYDDEDAIEPFFSHLGDLKHIFILRDGRTCIRSKLLRAGESIDFACRSWLFSVKLLRSIREGRVNAEIVRFEDLISTPVPILQRVCDFLGLEYTSEMLKGTNHPGLLQEYRRHGLDRAKTTVSPLPSRVMRRIESGLQYCGYIDPTTAVPHAAGNIRGSSEGAESSNPSRVRSLQFPATESNLPWTGERYLVGQGGEIEFEHYHRYLFAVQFCGNRDVLDIASGEGYGGLLLSDVARSVVGIDVDPSAVAHASTTYQRDNLKFVEGTCSKIPLPDQSIDVVVSFETIEHITEHDEFLSEVRRVLRPGGLLIISTPDRDVYAKPEEPNPFHLRELAKSEFYQLLRRYFPNLQLGSQKVVAGSVVLPDRPQRLPGMQVFHRVSSHVFEDHRALQAAPFLLGVASSAKLPNIKWGLLDDSSFLPELREEMALMAQQLTYQSSQRQSEVKELVERTHEQQQRLSAADRDLRQLVGEVADREQRLRSADADLRRLAAEVADREQRLGDADGDLRRLSGEVADREERLRDADRDLRQLLGEGEDREQRLRDADSDLRQLLGEAEGREQRLRDADTDLRQLLGEAEDREQRLRDADGDLRRLFGEGADREQRLRDADRDLRQLLGEAEDREQRLRDADRDLRRLFGEVADREQRLRDADRDLRRLLGEVEDREQRLSGADTDLRRLVAEVADREQRLRDADRDIRSLTREVEDREQRLTAADGDLRRLRAQIEQQNWRLSVANNELAAAEGRLQEIESSRIWRLMRAIHKLVPTRSLGKK